MSVHIPLVLLAIVNCAVSLELIAVQSIFRHGDRAPSSPYPKDPITVENWPNGWSQLTDLGAMQTRELGSFYRRTYAKKLKLFKPTDVYVRSTSKRRAIESAQNVLNGLYDRNQNLPEIHVAGEYKNDLLLKPNSVECKNYDDILTTENQILFKKYNLLYKGLFNRLSSLTGYNVTMETIDLVYDATYREVIHGLSEDKWLMDYVLNKETGELVTIFDMILELKRVQRLGEFNSIEKSRLRTGFLLGHVFGQFERIGSGEILPKFTLYSSHDATLTSLLYSLTVSNELLVPYAAAINFELYIDGLRMPTYYIKTSYRNETHNDQAYELQINGCDNPACEINQFQKVLEKAMFRTTEEHKMECEK
jgi:hypothetical protein